uniref:Proteasome activator complex subunit 4 C-terminal domain-containing protein n=1 Tax=Meloidogyne incognita TaxID=6306 RepID=A0A914LUY5_MELIC
MDEQIVKSAETLASSPKQTLERDSGVLALASIVLAFPDSVPSFLPKVLMHLCKHATEPQPIYITVKLATSDVQIFAYFFGIP